jgi:hypothetical protein
MFKIKIDVPGWESFSDLLGNVPFVNGVSAREVTEREMFMIGANVRVVKAETDEQVGASVLMANTDHLSAEVVAPLQTAEEEIAEVGPTPKYSREYLEDLADKGGIKAIRPIGAEFGVKNVQISGLIDEILDAQADLAKGK